MLILGMMLMAHGQTGDAVSWRLRSRSADGKPAETAVAWDPKKTAVMTA